MKRQRLKHRPGKKKWTPEELAEHKAAKAQVKWAINKLREAGFSSVMLAGPGAGCIVKLRKK